MGHNYICSRKNQITAYIYIISKLVLDLIIYFIGGRNLEVLHLASAFMKHFLGRNAWLSYTYVSFLDKSTNVLTEPFFQG